MFTSFSGYKSSYQDLTLVVVSEFNEWKVLAYAPGVTIHGTRQFTEAKAKEHAKSIAEIYVREHRHEEVPPGAELQWQPTGNQDWLVWRG
jgi:hypothetical protein